jgi:hypothetical protein
MSATGMVRARVTIRPLLTAEEMDKASKSGLAAPWRGQLPSFESDSRGACEGKAALSQSGLADWFGSLPCQRARRFKDASMDEVRPLFRQQLERMRDKGEFILVPPSN